MKSVKDAFNNIDAVAAESTERKSPGAKNASGESETTFFDAEAEQAKKDKEAKGNDPDQPDPNANPGKLSKEDIEASGKTGAFLSGGLIELVFNATERIVFVTKFSKAEKRQLSLIDEKAQADYTEDDERLNRKFLAISTKHDKIRAKIPLDEKSMDALAMAHSEQARITGKKMDPQLIMWYTIAKVVIDRGMEIFL